MRRDFWGSAFAITLAAAVVAAAQSTVYASETAAEHYDIPAQPLAAALTGFARSSHLKLAYPASLTRNLVTTGVSGDMTRDEALKRLLAGSGLSHRMSGDTLSIVRLAGTDIMPVEQTGVVPLQEISVEGKGGTATGPIEGYVARRSATAAKSDIPLIETPQAISVVGREQLRDQNAQSVVQALGYTAGVSTNVNPNDNRFESLRVRGFEPVIYLDGMQLPFGAGMFGRPKVDPFALERVEALRGPSSALYGQIPPGGFVNLISLRPLGTPQSLLDFEVDSHGRLQTGFDTTGPANADGTLTYRFTGLGHSGGTQIDHVDDDRGFVAPSFTWKPDDSTTLTVSGLYQKDDSGVAIQFLPKAGTLTGNPNGKIPLHRFVGEPDFDGFRRDQYWAGYEFEHKFDSGWTVRQKLRYAGLDTRTFAVIGAGLQADGRTLNRRAFDVRENADALTIDNQAEARFDTGPLSHIALFGLDLRRSTSTFKQFFGVAPSIDIFDPDYGQPVVAPGLIADTGQKQTQIGAYVQDQIALDKWRLTLSGRHDWVDTEAINELHAAAAPRTQRQKDQAFSGRVGLNYVFDSGLSPYVAYSRSFQPSPPSVGGAALKPTTGEQYEAGVKYQPDWANLSLAAAVFDLTQQNVTTTTMIGGVPQQTQTGEVRSRGFEFEAQASLTEGLKIVSAYSYTDTKVTRDGDANVRGNRLITVPRHQASFFADYTLQDGAARGFGFGGGVRYIGVSFGDKQNTLRIPGYALFDAALHYDLANLSSAPVLAGARLSVNATNILDKRYVSTCQSDASCFYGTGRTVTASVRFTW